MSEFEFGEGFPKSLRLLTSRDFDRLKSDSSVFQNSLIRVYSKKREEGELHARFGFAISKKVGKAHDRNRLKRLMREYVRKHELRSIKWDFLFVVSPRTLKFGSPAECEAKFLESLEHVAKKIMSSRLCKS